MFNHMPVEGSIIAMVRLRRDNGRVLATSSRARRNTLADVESLTVPLVQEVVFLADFRCVGCQKRVAEIMAKMNGETQSVVMSILEKKVTVTCTYPKKDSYWCLWFKASSSSLLRRLCSSCVPTSCASCIRTTN